MEKLVDGLAPWVDAVSRWLQQDTYAYWDLHADSMAAVQKMGPLRRTHWPKRLAAGGGKRERHVDPSYNAIANTATVFSKH